MTRTIDSEDQLDAGSDVAKIEAFEMMLECDVCSASDPAILL
jgi:hypothetical protein